MDLIPVNITVDNITQGYRLLHRFNDDERLTEVTVISNQKEIPTATAGVKYKAIPLDEFVGEKVEGWDGHSPLTLYFNQDGHFDHWEKTATGATAGAAA